MLEKNIPMIEAVAEVLNETKENLESKIADGNKEIESLKDTVKNLDDAVASKFIALSAIKQEKEKSIQTMASVIAETKIEMESKIESVAKDIDETKQSLSEVITKAEKISSKIADSMNEAKIKQAQAFQQLAKDFSDLVVDHLKDVKDGEDGADGRDGTDGRDRPIIEAMVVEPGDKVDKNTVVSHKGGLFISARKANGTPDNDPAGYNCVLNGVSDVSFTEVDERRTKMLVDMADGLQVEHIINTNSPVFKGPFKSTATYEKGDIVIKDKKTLIKVSDEVDEWKMFVFAGEKGEKGDTGAGVQGPAGVGISDIFAEGSNILFEMTDGTVKAIGMELPDFEENFEGARIRAFAGPYDSGDTYNAGDVVRSENGLWLALDTTTEFPSAKSSSWINMIYAGGSGGSGGGGGGQGPTGPAGPAGPPGKDGVDGSSAYEVALANGFVGTEAEWLASLKGEQGDQGIGLRYVGRVPTAGDLNSIVDPVHGDIYISDEDEHAYVWNSVSGTWDDAGKIVGEKGQTGNTGATGPAGPAGPTVVSADADNTAVLGSDGFIYVPKSDESGAIYSGEAPPIDAVENTLWYNTSNGTLYVYLNDGDSTQWVQVMAPASGAAVYSGETSPAIPFENQLWLNTVTGSMFAYLNDGTSVQWVEIVSIGNGPSDAIKKLQAQVDDLSSQLAALLKIIK